MVESMDQQNKDIAEMQKKGLAQGREILKLSDENQTLKKENKSFKKKSKQCNKKTAC
jgi:cell division protein FtsB